MLSKPTIMVGTDFSYHSDQALKLAETIRRRTGGSLHLVHASRYPAEWDWFTSDVVVNYLPDRFKTDLVASMNKSIAAQAKRCEARCETHVEFGRPAAVIRSWIQKHKVDLLVLGHHGHDEEGFHLGSLPGKIAAHCEVPLLIVNKDNLCEKIGALVDPLQPEKHVFDSAEELAFLLSSDLEFISLWQDISAQVARWSPVINERHLTYTDEERAEIQMKMRRTIAQYLSPQSKASVTLEITHKKNAGDALEELLRSHRTDLAVVERHQRGRIERLFVGSTTRRLLDVFEGNLLILPPEERKRG